MIKELGQIVTCRPDCTYGRPELRAVRAAVRRKDLSRVTRALAGQPDHDVRADLVYVAAEELVRRHGRAVPDWVRGWFDSAADDPHAWALRGAHAVLRAWKIRGYRRAASTSPDLFHQFHRVLSGAEEVCREAAALAPGDPTPWVLLVHMARGQEIGPDATLRRFGALTARCDTHLRGNEQVVLSLSPKWGTPVETLQGLVDEQYRAAAPGSPVRMNLVQAYIERWYNLAPAERQAFLARASVRSRAEIAISGWLEYGDTEGQHALHNSAAFWYTITGQHALARPHFIATRGHAKTFPWSYLPHPAWEFRKGWLSALRG
ncbi:hypothetical protein OG500_37945 [Kitasatospora sp. NBC_01250]|uniref:hypothetical protein n=1 Tax=Kitasatospora sp. NBC_01250 TaxID=2903571 RepID=UPI002E37AD4B|nr:hypothetical protein [Kitasatospora sp. NBC_01250]